MSLENSKQQKEHFAKVGIRTKELRLQHGYSIKKFEELLKLPSGTLHNLEHGKGGTGFNLLAIITYWSNEGYSLKWMLDFDNENHFKMEDQLIYLDIDKSSLIELSEELSSCSSKLKKIVNKYK